MSKVHIALVGGQPAPVYYGISATNPDIVVFIYSRDSENAVNPIKVRLASNGISCLYEDYPPIDPNEPTDIINCAQCILEKHIEDQIILNISGGTKPWTYLFSDVLKRHGKTEIIFIDQLNRIWNYNDYSHEFIKPLDLIQHLELYGNPLRFYTRYDCYTEEDDRNAVLIEEARAYNNNDFNRLTTVLSKETNHKLQHMQSCKWELSSGSFVEWCKPDKSNKGWVRLFLTKSKGRSNEFFIESEHAVSLVFNSGWFEYKVAKLLSSWSEAKEILLNCKFKTKKGADKNEADIIVRTSNRLLFVECKTHLHHTTDIDKFRTVVSTYGGTASLGLFITDVPMNEQGSEKCESVKLLPPFSYSSYYMGISREKALFTLLDTSIAQINR